MMGAKTDAGGRVYDRDGSAHRAHPRPRVDPPPATPKLALTLRGQRSSVGSDKWRRVEWTRSSLVPAIRVPNMAAGIEFYRDRLGFIVERGGPADGNVALSFGDARIMLDSVPTDYYAASYNEAIARRMGSAGPTALYIESPDVDVQYESLETGGIELVHAIADRPWGQREFMGADPHGTG